MKKLGKMVNSNVMDEQETPLEFFILYRETPPLNHKSKSKSPLKCLAQDHTGQRPRMEVDYNVYLNVPRTITLRYVRKFTFMFTIQKRKTTSLIL